VLQLQDETDDISSTDLDDENGDESPATKRGRIDGLDEDLVVYFNKNRKGIYIDTKLLFMKKETVTKCNGMTKMITIYKLINELVVYVHQRMK